MTYFAINTERGLLNQESDTYRNRGYPLEEISEEARYSLTREQLRMVMAILSTRKIPYKTCGRSVDFDTRYHDEVRRAIGDVPPPRDRKKRKKAYYWRRRDADTGDNAPEAWGV